MAATKEYRATLSKGRVGWCVIFRHPVSQSPDGKQRRRVRRGLGTKDQAEAQSLVSQLNEILADRSLWNPAARSLAEARFARPIVAAFFDALEPERFSPWADREAAIPLPSAELGYTTVQFVGTTGAGKTTVVRQLLGTNPKLERFPSISPAKTTVCDMEIVVADGPFRGAVSFLPRDQVRQYVSDCVAAAVMSTMEAGQGSEAARRFLEPPEHHFRLSYLLGTLPPTENADGETLEDQDTDEEFESWEAGEVGDDERRQLVERLQSYLSDVARLTREVSVEVAQELGEPLARLTTNEWGAFEELVERELLRHDGFDSLVDRILDDVEGRFELLSKGEVVPGRDGWPLLWRWETDDRSAFLREVNRFSSNYAPNFGRLLTPLVEGIRVAGPFAPQWLTGRAPRLVLLDGRGIGHAADLSASVSTSITRRYGLADLIVLVDNAAQPMQAASCSLLESLASSGHEPQLVIGFTHFDEVKGPNLQGATARKHHVLASLDNAIHAVGKALGRDAVQSLKRLLPNRVLFLSNLQKPLDDNSHLTRREFNRFLSLVDAAIEPTPAAAYRPVFDVANLVLAIQKATQEFHDRWRGILGMGSRSEVAPEPWQRVKALTRRVGVFGLDEFNTLKPVADFIRLLQISINSFLSSPLTWDPKIPSTAEEGQRSHALDAIKKQVWSRLHLVSRRRLIDERLSGWIEAFNVRGPGSARVRARELVTLYESAAPVPNEMPGPDANEFLFELREMVADAIVEGGGLLRGWARLPKGETLL